MSDFLTLYPGVYTEREKPYIEKIYADNQALIDRGEIDVKALINGTLPKDTPGVGPKILVTEAMLRYNADKYDPENPVLRDPEYARSMGYENIIAYPTFAAHDDSFMIQHPVGARDTFLVSQLNRVVTNYKPIYPGDTVYLISNSRYLYDLTPEGGSEYRTLAGRYDGSIYNQKGEKVSDINFSSTRGFRLLKPGKTMEGKVPWDAPKWTRRPAHYYTDEDWDYIKDLWSKEKRQGAEPLYWEDVKIGDEPTWTVDGPVEETVKPIEPWGMGLGGSRTMKKEIMDPEIFKTMIRGEKDGIYRLPNRTDYVPPLPEGVTMPDFPMMAAGKDPNETRSMLINYCGRDIAIRHIHNWMGDRAWIYNIRWSIMPPECHAAYGKIVPENPFVKRYLQNAPKMKDKHQLAHGVTCDLAVVKSQVYDKYINNGEFFVELAWWVETIDGYIWEEGCATIKLPSKNK